MEDTRLISVDYSNGSDFTVVTQACSKCRYVFSVENCGITNGKIFPKVFSECPQCGVEFKNSFNCK